MEEIINKIQRIQAAAVAKGSVDSFFLDIFVSEEGGPIISVSAYKTEDFEDDDNSVCARIYPDTKADDICRIINNIEALCTL